MWLLQSIVSWDFIMCLQIINTLKPVNKWINGRDNNTWNVCDHFFSSIFMILLQKKETVEFVVWSINKT